MDDKPCIDHNHNPNHILNKYGKKIGKKVIVEFEDLATIRRGSKVGYKIENRELYNMVFTEACGKSWEVNDNELYVCYGDGLCGCLYVQACRIKSIKPFDMQLELF